MRILDVLYNNTITNTIMMVMAMTREKKLILMLIILRFMLTKMWTSWRLPVQPAHTPVHPVNERMYRGR